MAWVRVARIHDTHTRSQTPLRPSPCLLAVYPLTQSSSPVAPLRLRSGYRFSCRPDPSGPGKLTAYPHIYINELHA